MPFAGFKDFEDCVKKTMAKKEWGRERASAYCAVIARATGDIPPAKNEPIKNEEKLQEKKSDSGWEELI